MTIDIRRDVLGRLKTAMCQIDDLTIGRRHAATVHAATAEARKQIARLERAIEAAEIDEGPSHV